MTLRVESPGLLALVQDDGRPGLGHLGVSRSGAFDRQAMHQANRLLGNRPGAAVLEVIGALALRAERPTVLVVTGAAGRIRVGDDPAAYGRAIRVGAGQLLRIDPPVVGLRTYVGVSGGLIARSELGSMSTDTMSGLGSDPLAIGDALEVAAAVRTPQLADLPALTRSGELTLDVVLGPRDDWFTPAAVRRLLESSWVVEASNRIGVRLGGPPLERSRGGELPSEPCLRGSIQVAADGQPIIFGPDHPVTGGYPVIAVVVDAHTDRIAQAAPGQVLRFRPVV